MANTKIIEGQTTQWPFKKKQDRQHNDQYKKNRMTDNTIVNTKRTEGQTTQWPIQKEQKDRQHNGQYNNNRRTKHYTEN